jgi:ribose-phosphate pyrophosphokinase
MTCAVFGFPDCAAPAARLARELGVAYRDVTLRHFPDGESLIRVPRPPETAFLYRSLDDPNGKIVELLLAASALRENGAAMIVLVVPYLAYMRQDVAFHPGEAISQRVVGRLLAQCCDALLTVDAHLHRLHDLTEIMPAIDAVNLSAAPVLSAALNGRDNPLLVGPDGESRQWVEAVAGARGLEFVLGRKQRLGDRDVELAIDGIEAAAGRSIVLVDDLVSSGVTMKSAARLLQAAGATRIEALVTHCLADACDLEDLEGAGISLLRATDTVAGPSASIQVAGLLAQEIARRGWLR